jgi:putative protease
MPDTIFQQRLPRMQKQPIQSVSAPELLAPAGGPDAGYAALHYGADAVYLGLKRFSARSEAENFSINELGEFAAFAHSLKPRRRVYVTLNTLLRNDELSEASGLLLDCAGAGADAVIVQDLGVARIAQSLLPGLSLHASTQMAIHSVDGVMGIRQAGFSRVNVASRIVIVFSAELSS